MSSARVSMLVQAIIDQATGDFGGDELKTKTKSFVSNSGTSLVDNTTTDGSWSIDDLFADGTTANEDKNSNSNNVEASQVLSPENTLSPELYARIPHTMIFGTYYYSVYLIMNQ